MADPTPDERRSTRWRDAWQLHLPLVIVLALCTAATIIEARRAGEGVWRAWAYMFEWPLIGLFAIWIWNRYRRHGSLTRGLAERWRSHVAQYGDADPDPEHDAAHDPPSDATPAQSADPQLGAWRAYVADLQRRDPPGAAPGE